MEQVYDRTKYYFDLVALHRKFASSSSAIHPGADPRAGDRPL